MQSPHAGNIIEVQNLQKTYKDTKALKGVSFQVSRGEVFGILGPNGAGKTTTVEILEGLRGADSGEVFINGINVIKNPQKVKSIIGVQLQSSAFFNRLTLAETVTLYSKAYEKNVNPLEVLKLVNMEEKASSYYRALSGGQKQRLSLAIGLVNDPDVLFLDEPTTGLDPQARRNLWKLVKEIRSRGKTILMTTHYMEEAEELCDRVAIMNAGSIVALDSPDNLIDDLLSRGFKRSKRIKEATLEDVFIDLTGRSLFEE